MTTTTTNASTVTATIAPATAEAYCVLSLREIRNLLDIAKEAARLRYGNVSRFPEATSVVLRGRCDAYPEDNGKVQVRLETAAHQSLFARR
jgi:hypothetical protein